MATPTSTLAAVSSRNLSTELQIPTQLRASNNSINKLTKIYATTSTNTDFVFTSSVSTNTVGVECNLDQSINIDSSNQTQTDCDTDKEIALYFNGEHKATEKVFYNLENFLKYWLDPSSGNDNVSLVEQNTLKTKQYDLNLNKRIINFILDSFTDLTTKQNFTKIDSNCLAFINLSQMLQSPEFSGGDINEQVFLVYYLMNPFNIKLKIGSGFYKRKRIKIF